MDVRTMKSQLVRAFTLLSLLALGCRDKADQAVCTSDSTAEFPTDTLRVADSIGIEWGDSCYVFGAIRGVGRGPVGEILVLDGIRDCIMVYDGTGRFVDQVGRCGSGPGEMTSPAFFVVLGDGSICVMDESGWIRFNSAREFLDSRQPAPCRPMQMISHGQDGIVGIESRLSFVDQGIEITKSLSLWSDSTPGAADVVYFSRAQVAAEPQDVYLIDLNPMLFAAGESQVYLAPDPVDEPVVYVFGIDGIPLDTLRFDYPRIERTEEEMADEELFYESHVSLTTSDQGQVDWEPSPYRPMIGSLGVDSLDQLWIQRGFELSPTFDIYDPSSLDLVSTALIPGRDDAGDWRFHVSRHGVIAFTEDPDLYQQVLLIE
jgi:hypothetical protein